MNLTQESFLNLEFWKQFKLYSEHNMNRYINFIKSRIGVRDLNNTESHHIIPKCLVKNNYVVSLTPREHYIAHVMLSKCFSGNIKYKMIKTILLFKTKSNINSKIYEKYRNLSAESQMGENNTSKSESTRIKMSLAKNNKYPNERFSTKGYVSVYKNEDCFLIKKEELEKYLKDGYAKGRTTIKNGVFSKGYNKSEEHRRKISEKMKIIQTGKKFVNDGTNLRLIEADKLDLFLEDNPSYHLGFLKRKI